MKEATGELSTTVITIVAIAAISTLFLVFLYPQLKANILLNQACSNGPGSTGAGNGYTITCGTVGTSTTGTSTGGTTGGTTGGKTRTKTCNANGAAEATNGQTWTCTYNADN